MIAGRHLRKKILYNDLAHVVRRIQGLSALFHFVLLKSFSKFLVRFSKSVRF